MLIDCKQLGYQSIIQTDRSLQMLINSKLATAIKYIT